MKPIAAEAPAETPRALSLLPDEERSGVEQIYRDYAAFVWRLLRAMGVRDADALDVTQEVFITIHRRLGDTQIRTSLRAWVYGICLRTAANYRRRRHNISERLCWPVPDPASNQPDRAGARLDLQRALDRLDEARRAVFLLYEVEGLSMPEVAEALGCPVTTAYSRLHSARKAVRAAFGREAGDP